MSSPAMIEEADKHCKSAEKKLKKSFFGKWSITQSDYDVAALEYEKAAKIYQLGQRHEQALKTWDLAAANHSKADMPFNEGRSYEAMAGIYKDLKNEAAQVEYLLKSGEAFLEDGKPDKCADAYGKSARVKRESDPKGASELVNKALDLLHDNELLHMMPELGRLNVAITTKAGDYVAAAAAVKLNIRHLEALQQPHNITKAAIELVVLHLARDDAVLAKREFSSLSSKYPMDGGEVSLCEDLILAFEETDADMLQEATSRQLITFIHPDIARLAKKLRIKGEKPSNAAKTGGGALGEDTAAAGGDDDEAEDWM